MKQAKRNKGFSLIELIVVIAVIAAIAAVIVPQFTNITGAARNATDQRSAQMWNQVYQDVYAITNGDNGIDITAGDDLPGAQVIAAGEDVPGIDITVSVNGADMQFTAAGFTLEGSSGYAIVEGTGLVRQ